MKKDRKCRNCGRTFQPKEPGDVFCSSLCRATGKFMGGGGDTSKPMNPEQKRAMERKGKRITAEEGEEKGAKAALKYPHVVRMFDLPMDKRWAVAKKFTPEEAAYARRIMKRKLIEERKLSMCCDWCGEEWETEGGNADGDSLGDSDDGTI